MLFVEDENGLFTDDPKRGRGARFIPRTSAHVQLELYLADSVLERVVLVNMIKAAYVLEVQAIAGLRRGNVSRRSTASRSGRPST